MTVKAEIFSRPKIKRVNHELGAFHRQSFLVREASAQAQLVGNISRDYSGSDVS